MSAITSARSFSAEDIGDPARFWDRVERRSDDECWLWLGAKTKHGYGNFQRGPKKGKRKFFSHRVAYALANGGKLPNHLMILHTCDNPACCNPKHLFVGSQFDNMRDAAKKGRLSSRPFNGKRREIITPRGVFRTAEAAAAFNGVHKQTIRRRARLNIFGFSYGEAK